MKSPSVTHLRSGSELTLSKGFAAARQVQKKGLPEHYPCKRVLGKFETSSARAHFFLPQVPHICIPYLHRAHTAQFGLCANVHCLAFANFVDVISRMIVSRLQSLRPCHSMSM